MVPRTTLADLDDVHLELAVFGGHLVQLRGLLDPALVPPEFVAVHVGDVGELYLAADRAGDSVGSPWNFAARSR